MTARKHLKTIGSVHVVQLDQDTTNGALLFKALGSEPRLQILRLLANCNRSVNEIAEALDMPTSTVAMHINVLERAGLIQTELTPASRGVQKVCYRICDQLVVTLPKAREHTQDTIELEMPIGAYSDCQVQHPCGLASESGVIGQFDDPSSFYDPDHIYAQLLWFKQGYVEYRFPNRPPKGTVLEFLQISLELCSEAPLYNDNWPSDITMWINGVEIGTWTSPGDFGGLRGNLTPAWWEDWSTQYGILKVWKVTDHGTYVDGIQVSDVTLKHLNLGQNSFVSMRLGIKNDALNVGGMNLFGRKFGNYPQDILIQFTYATNTGNERR